MVLFNNEVELIVPPKKQNTNNKTIEIKSWNGCDAIRKTLDEGNTMTAHASATQHQPVANEKPKTKVSIGL